MMKLSADVLVLGSGFGGCLSALILDKLGLRTVVVDRAAHPRFAIGESSTPIADLILKDLSERYGLPRLKPLSAYGPWREHYPHLGVGRKRGFSYFHHEPGAAFRPDPEHGNELLVAASSGDYLCDTHWLRADVDAFFADEVRRSGIPLLEKTEITPRQEDTGWMLEGTRQETPVTVSARFILDATGAAGVLPQVLRLLESPCSLRTQSRALFSHFEGVERWQDLIERWGGDASDHPYACDAAALHHVFEDGWMWMLRFDSGLVSAGFALDLRRRPIDPAKPAVSEWQDLIGRFPSLQKQFAGAKVASTPGNLIRTGRLQRRVTRAAGPDWALLPSTAGFIDPLHSTGIAHTLSGVERLAAILSEHWERPELGDALHDYSSSVLREISMIDALVGVCYDALADFRLFTASVMLYFTAVVNYERARIKDSGKQTSLSFLGADNDDLVSRIERSYALLSQLRRAETLSDDVVHTYTARIEEAIAPYNTVGLFHPPRPNMYHHTAART